MIQDIKPQQTNIEGRELSNQSEVERKAGEILNKDGIDSCRDFLTEYCATNAQSVLDDWWRLADFLVVKYSNGMINDFQNNTTIRQGYPNWWLNETGYQYGPRIYQYAELQNVSGLIYVNETAYTQPGNELNYIEENQRI